jgi:hypothetical protein
MHRTTDNKFMGIQLVQITKQHLLFLRADHGLASIHNPAFGKRLVTRFYTNGMPSISTAHMPRQAFNSSMQSSQFLMTITYPLAEGAAEAIMIIG